MLEPLCASNGQIWSKPFWLEFPIPRSAIQNWSRLQIMQIFFLILSKNKAWHFIWNICQQAIHMIYILFGCLKAGAKFVNAVWLFLSSESKITQNCNHQILGQVKDCFKALTVILQIFYVLKILSASCICCINSYALQKYFYHESEHYESWSECSC